MNTPPRLLRLAEALILIAALFLLVPSDTLAGSASWKSRPTSGDWNNAANWRPRTIPNGAGDTATFAVSDMTNIVVTAGHPEVDGIVFAPGASPFTITTSGPASLSFAGAGVVNNSGMLQNFVSGVSYGYVFDFSNKATAGSQTMFTLSDTSVIAFYDEATAGSGTFTVQGTPYFEDGAPLVQFFDTSTAANGIFVNMGGSGSDGQGGVTSFSDNSTAADGTFTNTAATALGTYYGAATSFADNATAAGATISNEGGAAIGEHAGYTAFYSNATAGNSLITCNGGQAAGAEPGEVDFYGTSNAGNATLIANDGSNGGDGGAIQFWDTSDGGTARAELFGNGTLDISGVNNLANISIGSLEGDGIVLLGSNTLFLTIGTNDLSTVFSGVIQGSGVVTKGGSGTLTLKGANTYTGGTTVVGGFLKVNNRNGSATGSGQVTIYSGATLGGDGIVSSSMLVFSGGTLAPGTGVSTLTVKKKLLFSGGSYYAWRVKTISAKADKVIAGAVIIGSGAFFSGIGIGNTALPPGTTFVAIDNISSDPISGTFALLPDGGTITIGNNIFQANYEGGDGNDLTLTVVP